MGLFSNITKGIIKNGAKIAKQFDEINDDTSKKISKSTSIFDMQREEILRAAEEKKRKLLEEERKKREEAEMKKIESKQEKEEEEAQQQQTIIENTKKKDKEDTEETSVDEVSSTVEEKENVKDYTSIDDFLDNEYQEYDENRDYQAELAQQQKDKISNAVNDIIGGYKESISNIANPEDESFTGYLKRIGDLRWNQSWNAAIKGGLAGLDTVLNGLKIMPGALKFWDKDAENERAYKVLKGGENAENNSVFGRFNLFDNLLKESSEGENTVEKVKEEIDNIAEEAGLEAYNNWAESSLEHSEQYDKLEKELADAKKAGDTELQEQIEKQMEYHKIEYFRDFYEYSLGIKIEGDTVEAIAKFVAEKTGADIKDVYNYNIKHFGEKIDKVLNAQAKINKLATDFEIRSNYNVAQLPVEKTKNVLQSFGAIIGSEQEETLYTLYHDVEDTLQNYDAQIAEAQREGDMEKVAFLQNEKQNYKYGMSLFSEYMQNATINILNGNTDYIGKCTDLILSLYESKEAAELKKLLTNPNTIKQFTDKSGNIDYVALGKYLNRSKELKQFEAVSTGYKNAAEGFVKQDKYDNAKTIFGKARYGVPNYLSQKIFKYQEGYDYIAGEFKEVYQKYLEQGGELAPDELSDEYIHDVLGATTNFSTLSKKERKQLVEGKDKYYTVFGYLAGKINESDKSGEFQKARGELLGSLGTDDVTLGVKRTDPLYAQSQYYRFMDNLEKVASTLAKNPYDTSFTALAISLPFLGTAGTIEEGLVGLGKVMNMPKFAETIWNGGAAIVGEAAEGQLMNAIFDATSYGDPQPIWDLLDVGVGVFKTIPYIKELVDFNKFKTMRIGDNTEGLVKSMENVIEDIKGTHGSAITKLDDLTLDEKTRINEEFLTNQGMSKLVGKSATDYMDDGLNIDWKEVYKDYATNRLKYLGLGADAENNSMLKKLQQQAFYNKLDNMTDKQLDYLYKYAEKRFGDENIVKKIASKSGKKGVINEWLSGEMNTLRRIGNIKATTNLLTLAEKAGNLNAGIDARFDPIINGIKGAIERARLPQEKQMLEEALDAAYELKNNERLLPLMLNEENLGAALRDNKIKVEDFNEKYAMLRKLWDSQKGNGLIGENGELLAVVDGGVSGLDRKIVDMWLAGDKEGVVREILGNKADYEKIGVKVYNAAEYKKAIEGMSSNMLTDGQKQRLGQVLDVLNKVNNNSINIIELPENLRKQITTLQGFMGYLEDGGKQETVITLATSLIGGAKNQKFSDIKVLCHELGHTLLGSLNKQVKSQLMLGILKTIEGKEMGPTLLKKLATNLSEGRIDVLMDLYKKKDKTEFVEELAADIMSNAIVKGIKGDENSIATVGDNIIKQMAKGSKITEFVTSDKPFEIIGNKFVDMLTVLDNVINTSSEGYKELKGIMHYIAATILEGGQVSSKTSKSLKEAGKNMVFGRKGKFYGFNESLNGTAVDNEGRLLSLGQERYFKNSKIVDNEGRLLRVYHGTTADPFEAFNIDFARKKSDIQGAFFSPWEDEAKGYGPNVGVYYLNITNPAPREEAYKVWASFEGQNDRGVLTRLELQKRGYDGVISYGDEIIAFSPEQIKSIDNRTPTKSPKFMAYEEKQARVDKADFNYAKEKAEKIETMEKDITEFDVARIYSTQRVINVVEDQSFTVEDLSQLLSTKWLDRDLQFNILKGLSPENKTRFEQAMILAEVRQGIGLSTLMGFWKNGKLDLKAEFNGRTFADILGNLSPNITKNGYVEWAGIDFIKYLNAGNKEVYNKLFKDYIDLLEPEYYPEVIEKITERLRSAGIQGEKFSDLWLDFTNKVQDSILKTAKDAGMSEDMSKSLSEDVVSRMFAGAFYYMSNIYYIENVGDLSKLVDDMAYGLVLKNKNQSMGDTFNALYDDVIKQYNKVGERDETFVGQLGRTQNSALIGEDPTLFRWRRYDKDVYNRLATRTHGFIENALKGLDSIDLDQKYWVSFVNKVGNQQSQVKEIIGKRVADTGLTSDMLDLDGLRNAHSIDEVVDVYVEAINEKTPKILEAIPDESDRKALISELEKLKTEGFSDSDYKWLLDDLEGKYMTYVHDDMDLTDYFRATLTSDRISELNRTESAFEKAKAEVIPSTWSEEMRKSAEGIDTVFNEENVQTQLEALTQEIKNWSNLVDEGEAGEFQSILDFVLKDDAMKGFFNIEDPAGIVKLKTDLTTSSMGSIRKMVIDVNTKEDVQNTTPFKQAIGFIVNSTSVAAKDPEVGRILQGCIDFVNGKTVYVGDGALKTFLSKIKVEQKNYYGIKALANEITKVLEEEGISKFSNGSADKIFNDIAEAYKTRFATQLKKSAGGDIITDPKIRKRDPKKINYTMTWQGPVDSELYVSAVDAYVDLLAKRHSTFGWFKNYVVKGSDGREFVKNELEDIFGKIKNDGSVFIAIGSDKRKEASKLQGLKGYWLGASSSDLKKLDNKAAVWHPKLFSNFLYKSYAQTDKTFTLGDKALEGYRAIERGAANAMYTTFYNPIGAGIPIASQQVITNYIEIASKTLGELSDIDVEPEVYEEISKIVKDLMPSELVSRKGGKLVGNRAELDVPGRTLILGRTLSEWIGLGSTLTWADKSAENMVKRYALVSSLMDLGLDGRSTKELISQIIAKQVDFDKLLKIGEDQYIMDYDKILKTSPDRIKYQAQSKIDKLKADGIITNEAGNAAYRYILELNEMAEPLRYAAKQANFKKNAFFQISNVPELTQNMLAGWAGAANTRFINWASRKAGEYAFNVADAICRKDWKQLGKYLSSVTYRGFVAAKIYRQMDKATSDGEGANYWKFMETMFLPYVALNMTLLSAGDIIKDSYKGAQRDDAGFSGFLSTVIDGLLGVGENLKGRWSYAILYWLGQFTSYMNGKRMLGEKAAATDYMSGLFSSVPVLRGLEQMASKAGLNRFNKFFDTRISGVYSNDSYAIAPESSIVNLLGGGYLTNDALALKYQQDTMNRLMYGGKDAWDGTLNLELLGYKRDSSYAFTAFNKYLYESDISNYMKLGTDYSKLRENYDTLYKDQKLYKSIEGLGIDVQAMKDLGKIDEDLWRSDWGDLAGSQKIAVEKAGATPWSDTILNAALLQGASFEGLWEAGAGITTEERNEFNTNVTTLLNEMIEEVDTKKAVNRKSLYDKAYDTDYIEGMIRKYGNTYGEEIIIATAIKALVSAKKSELIKNEKKALGKYGYQDVKYEGELDAIANEVAKYKNDLVETYYPTLVQGNQYIAHTMMFAHAAMRDDNPLSGSFSLTSALGAPIDVEWTTRNVRSQGLPALMTNSTAAILATKVLNSDDVSWEDKAKFMEEEIEYAKKLGPFVEDLTKTSIAIPMLKHFKQLYNVNPKLFDENPEMYHDAMKMVTVSRPLSNEAIKDEVRQTIFKNTGSGSGSGSKGRKGSISFNKPLADKLTKFQSFKRQFEKNVMGQEPLSNIAYKPTSNGVTPIQLSVGEAHEIDQKYTFIKPKQPESEKTPDIIVKQVKTSKSTYSGKSIKQSNIYKVKRIV